MYNLNLLNNLAKENIEAVMIIKVNKPYIHSVIKRNCYCHPFNISSLSFSCYHTQKYNGINNYHHGFFQPVSFLMVRENVCSTVYRRSSEDKQ